MIKNIKSIDICDASRPLSEYSRLPILPHTAKYSTTSSIEDAGRVEVVNMEFVCRIPTKRLREPSICLVTFEDGTVDVVGTRDVPVQFEVTASHNVVAKLKYSRAE